MRQASRRLPRLKEFVEVVCVVRSDQNKLPSKLSLHGHEKHKQSQKLKLYRVSRALRGNIDRLTFSDFQNWQSWRLLSDSQDENIAPESVTGMEMQALCQSMLEHPE